MRLAHFACLFILDGRHDGGVDRSEIPNEGAPGDAKPDLRLVPGLIRLLGLEDFAHGIANWDQLADEARMLLEDAVGRPALLDLDGGGRAIDHLHQGAVRPDEVAAFANRGTVLLTCSANSRLAIIRTDRLRRPIVNRMRQMEDRGRERLVQIGVCARQASVGFAVRARSESVCAEHHLRMLGEIPVDPDRSLIGPGADLGEIEPRIVPGGLAVEPLAEEQNVDDDVGASFGPEAALRQADCADEIGHRGDVLACGCIRLVHCARGGDKRGEPAALETIDRLRDEVVMQAQAERAVGTIAAHGAVGKGRVADREVEVRLQLGSGKILVEDLGAWLQEFRDPGGHRVELHAGDVAEVAQPSGINAGNRPLPMPGSSTRPPRKPSRSTAVQTARTMYSGVKWAYWVQRASEA